MNLNEMAAEVKAVNDEKGWHDKPRTHYALIALLHSEVSEALEAYRLWGFADATEYFKLGPKGSYPALNPKPEGVGSELADVLIRWLDMGWDALHLDLDAEVDKRHGMYGINVDFMDAAGIMHMHLSRVLYAIDSNLFGEDDEEVAKYFVAIYRYLVQWADHLGIDLAAEYRRKLDYNKTRPFMHGKRC